MNDQPQPNNLQPNSREGEQPLYKPAATNTPSTFSGYDLTQEAQPMQSPAPVAPLPSPTPSATPAAAPPEPEEPMVATGQPLQQPTIDLHWEASEYIHHTKNFSWYFVYVAVMLVLLALAYFVTHSWTFIALVIVMSIAIGIYANRPPRTLHYGLTNSGIQIDQTVYKYADFRAFGIMNDGGLYSIMLIPAKRFLPAVSIYFAEDDGEDIVDILGARLPMEEIHLDVVDRLVRRLRF